MPGVSEPSEPSEPPAVPDAASSIGTHSRNRYPWRTWTAPGSGPFRLSAGEADPDKLSSVLRTHAARKGLAVRIRRAVDEGLLFQFGPPFSPVLDLRLATVSPGVTVPGDICPTCGGSLGTVEEALPEASPDAPPEAAAAEG